MLPIEVAKKLYAEFGAGNLPGVLALLSDNVSWELIGPTSIPYFGNYSGPKGVAEFFSKLFEMEDIQKFEAKKFLADGSSVIVLGSEECCAKSSGKKFCVEWVHIIEVLDSKIVLWREIIDTHPIVEAYA